MEIRVLQYFLAVAREQSISAAAESLHITQPALSTQMKALEDELGKQLLVRGRKGSRRVLLTEDGMLLRRRAEEILTLVRKTEDEMSSTDNIAGDVVIGAGETDVIRCFARAAKEMQSSYPDVHYHILSGNAEYVLEYLDKGLIDFGLLFTEVDTARYEHIDVPVHDTWGVLMRRDCPLASKPAIDPAELRGERLILSQQSGDARMVARWIGVDEGEMNVVATYNLVYNASLLVDEGLGIAVTLDKLINTAGSSLCFRPFEPRIEATTRIVWKKYQVFSRAADAFLKSLRQDFENVQESGRFDLL